MENALDGTNSTLDMAAEETSEFADVATETIQNETGIRLKQMPMECQSSSTCASGDTEKRKEEKNI